MTDVERICERGLGAVEADDESEARRALEEIRDTAAADHPARLLLEGVFAWASGDLDEAEEKLGASAERPGSDPRASLHFAELVLARLTRLGDAEATLRGLLGREALDAESRGDATLLLAQCRLADDDPEEALELLDGLAEAGAAPPASAENGALWLGTRAEALTGLGRHADAIASLRGVAELESDADLQYLLGATLIETGDTAGAAEAWRGTLALDGEADDDYPPLEAAEVEALRARLEDTMGSLPQPVLERLASARVEVVTRVSAEDVGDGADPRGFVFLDATGRGDQASVSRVVVQRNVVLDILETDDELEEAMVQGLVEEAARVLEIELLGGAG